MDTRDGNIYEESEMMKKLKVSQKAIDAMFAKYLDNVVLMSEARFFAPMKTSPTEKQMSRKPPRVGRNELCPCGSGKKFKKCCLNSIT